MSPADDVVASITYGSLACGDRLPSYIKHFKKFGLTQYRAEIIINNVKSVLLKWKPVFENYDVSTADIENITRVKGIYSGLQ